MNKYQIIDTIGQGQYGVVLKAKNRQTGQLVAIKKFKEDDSDQQNKKVILRQVKILKMLDHQNVIQLKQAFRKQFFQRKSNYLSLIDLNNSLFQIFFCIFNNNPFRKGKIYLVCEYVEKNLLEILQEGSITAQRVKHYTFQLLKGVFHMHQNNIIHRDIKPQNVLISKTDILKICDLGFARTMPSNGTMTDYVATRWYRPPQLLIGRQDYDKSIDVWAVGCVMAEMIDGQPLFGGENDLDQLYLIQKCIGPLIPQHHEYFLKNPKFIGMKFPQIHTLDPIERRYFGKIDKNGLDLLKKMLVMDPKGRISIQKALAHPYFGKLSSNPLNSLLHNNSHEFQMKKSFHQARGSPLIQQQFPSAQNNNPQTPHLSSYNNHYNLKTNHNVNANLNVNIPMNNFLKQEKQKAPKSKDERAGGVNKVTGLNKIMKLQNTNNGNCVNSNNGSNTNINTNASTNNNLNMEQSLISQNQHQSNAQQSQQQTQWFMANKGKSIMKKHQGKQKQRQKQKSRQKQKEGITMRQKSINNTNYCNNQKNLVNFKNVRQTNAYEDDYYQEDQHWGHQQTLVSHINNHINNNFVNNSNPNGNIMNLQGNYKKHGQRADSQLKKKKQTQVNFNTNSNNLEQAQEKGRKRKKTIGKQITNQNHNSSSNNQNGLQKNQKDNYNIIFNNNTYNLNIIDDTNLK